MDATIKLYGPEFSYFLRAVRIMCFYKGLQHEVTAAPLNEPVAFFSEAHTKLHPFRKLPVLIDGDTLITESLAMAHYLESKPGPSLFPGDPIHKALIESAALNIVNYVHAAVVRDHLLEFAFPKGPDKSVRINQVKQNLDRAHAALAWCEQTKSNTDYFIGDSLSVCDAYLLPMFDYLKQLPEPFNLIKQYPKLNAYLDQHKDKAYCKHVLGPGPHSKAA